MTKRLLELEPTSLFGENSILVAFSGREAISEPFEFSLTIDSEKTDITPQDVIGKPIAVRLNRSTSESQRPDRYFHGYISHLEATQTQHAQSGVIKSRGYRVTVVPWIWFMSQAARCFVYLPKLKEKSIKQIYDDLLKRVKSYNHVETWEDAGGATLWEKRKVEHCVQYRETDFNFFSRLCESHGVGYYFTHEATKHTLVLFDKSNYPNCGEPEVRFPPDLATQAKDDHITYWERDFVFVSGRYSQTDYDFLNPSTDLKVSSAKSGRIPIASAAGYELYDNPNDYVTKGDGKEEAARRMEEEETPYDTISGESTYKLFRPGHFFKLAQHYTDPAEANKDYLLTAVMHHATQPGRTVGAGGDASYQNSFTCIPKAAQYRPTRRTPLPTIPGIQTAIVVGPSGEEIYTDEYGRVKVQFHWDREGQRDENTCCWVRVSQSHSGRGFGGIDIPRVGEEVVISYIDGDPDRPLITGRVYHKENTPPFQLPKHKTRSGVRSKTYKDQGHNEMIFEDKTGDERIFVHAQKRMDVRVRSDSKTRIYGHRHQIIGWEKDGDKGGDQREMVYQDKHLNVKRHQVEKIEGNMQLTVGKGEADDGGNLDIVVEKKKSELIEGDSDFIVKGDQKQKIDGTSSLTVGGDQHLKVNGNIAAEAGAIGEIHLKAGMKVIIEAGMQISIVGPGGFIDIGPAGVTIQGIMVNINSGGSAGSGSGCKAEEPEEAKPAEPAEPEVAADSRTTD